MTIVIPTMKQEDEALRLLAGLYHRWFLHVSTDPWMDVYIQIRDILSNASSLQEACNCLMELAQTSPEEPFYQTYTKAHEMIHQVILAGGSADALIIGETDGFRHLCLKCCQDEHNIQRVRFFNTRERRPLLKPEIRNERRSVYSKCQICLQPINPDKLVIFTHTGTARHRKGCTCRECNRAGTAYLLSIYECERDTQRVILPFLQQVSAPSKQQSVEQAITLCWENGWHMLNKDAFRP
jgi:hypothetical protein